MDLTRTGSLAAIMFGLTLVVGVVSGCNDDAGLEVCNGPDCGTVNPPVVETLELRIADGAKPELVVSCPAPGPSPEQLQVRAFCREVGTGKEREVTTSTKLHFKSGNPNILLVDDGVAKGRVQARCFLPYGGPQYVTAEGECGRASLSLNLDYHAPDFVAGDLPPGAPPGCGDPPAPDPDPPPTIVYPLDGALHAENLYQITLQWKAPVSAALFRLRAVGDYIDASFYVGAQGLCFPDPTDPLGHTNNCQWRPPADRWRTISHSARGGKVALTITGCSGPGNVADSEAVTLRFSSDPVQGGLYYFTPTTQGSKRIPFGAPYGTDFLKGGANSNVQCVGCHAVSPDGKKLAATFLGADGVGGIVDARSGGKYLKSPLQAPVERWNFATFSPDGELLLTNWNGVLTLRDGDTGARKFDVDPKITGGRAIMPAWSPDGTRVAFVQVPPEGKLGSDFPVPNAPKGGDWVAANTGNLAVMRFENGAFQPARVVLPSEKGVEYHYQPSWSPDSSFLIFVTATAPGFAPAAWKVIYGVDNPVLPPEYRDYVMTYDQRETRLRLLQINGQGEPVGLAAELDAATRRPSQSISWPRFAPFQQGQLAFVTYAARFDYGFVVAQGERPQMWMAAIDLGQAVLNQHNRVDASFPPVWLPFQDPRGTNYAATWTQQIACATNDDCGEGFRCQAAVCTAL